MRRGSNAVDESLSYVRDMMPPPDSAAREVPSMASTGQKSAAASHFGMRREGSKETGQKVLTSV